MRIVELRIDPGGQVRLETRGFAGRGCLRAATFLKTCLGKIVGEQLTREFYATAEESARLEQTLDDPPPDP